MTPEICPNCGAEVPGRARACPECGSSEDNGWSEEAQSTSLNLPDEDFNYSEFVEREFGDGTPKPSGISWLWWIVGIVLVAAFVLLAWPRR